MLTGKSKLAGVMGWPVSHSLSPRLHGFWLDAYGIDGAYVPLAVKPERFATSLRALADLGFAGVNVTVPHKEAALAAADELDPVAERTGAVNTIVFASDGEIRGANTDAFGFLENLTSGISDWNPSEGAAVVLGAGGAARAVLVALIDAGVPEIRLLNRTAERAREVAADIDGPITPRPWQERNDALDGASLVVNTTTLGMAGQALLDLDLSALPTSAAVTDIVYSPLETPLLSQAKARGNRTVDGLGMLLHQARPGFEAWFGRAPDVDDELRRYVLAGRET